MKKIINYLIVLLAIFIIPLSGNAKEKDITLYLFHGDGCPQSMKFGITMRMQHF